jgi:hypothetical protein
VTLRRIIAGRWIVTLRRIVSRRWIVTRWRFDPLMALGPFHSYRRISRLPRRAIIPIIAIIPIVSLRSRRSLSRRGFTRPHRRRLLDRFRPHRHVLSFRPLHSRRTIIESRHAISVTTAFIYFAARFNFPNRSRRPRDCAGGTHFQWTRTASYHWTRNVLACFAII